MCFFLEYKRTWRFCQYWVAIVQFKNIQAIDDGCEKQYIAISINVVEKSSRQHCKVTWVIYY